MFPSLVGEKVQYLKTVITHCTDPLYSHGSRTTISPVCPLERSNSSTSRAMASDGAGGIPTGLPTPWRRSVAPSSPYRSIQRRSSTTSRHWRTCRSACRGLQDQAGHPGRRGDVPELQRGHPGRGGHVPELQRGHPGA